MKIPLLLLAGLLLQGICTGLPAQGKSGNPLFRGWYADPHATIYGDTYWIYPTTSDIYEKQVGFDCFSSKDLIHWEKHTGILDTAEIKWAKKCMRGPGTLEKEGEYYLFFEANNMSEDETGGIGVAVSDRPEGPYRDLTGNPLIGEIVNGAHPSDQFVFEKNGEYYMYYGGKGHCNVVKLKPDFTGLEPFDDGTFFKEITPEKYVGRPLVFEKSGRYYFMWSEDGKDGPGYSAAYAISNSPIGPFRRIGTILQQDPEIAACAELHSIVDIPGTNDRYIFYHRRPLTETNRNHKETCVEKMEFREDGLIEPVTLTHDGVEARKIGYEDRGIRFISGQ